MDVNFKAVTDYCPFFGKKSVKLMAYDNYSTTYEMLFMGANLS